MRKKTRLWIGLCAALFLGFCSAQSAVAGENDAEAGDATAKEAKVAGGEKEIVAELDGEPITRSDLEKEMAAVAQQAAAAGGGAMPSPEKIKDKALDNVVTRMLLYRAASEAGVEIEKERVDSEMQKVVSRFQDDKAFEAAIEQRGLTRDEVETDIRNGLTVQKYIEEKYVEDTEVSDEEVKAYYDENPESFKRPEMVKARHILIKSKASDPDEKKAEARQKIEDLEKKIKEGGDFAELAKEHSECPSAKKGGDLGFFQKGQMVPPFEEAAFALVPGETSSVVETRFGYHLIRVEEKKEDGSFSMDEAEARIRSFLLRKKVQEKVAEKLEAMKADAKLEKKQAFGQI